MKITLINPCISQEIAYGKRFKRLGAVLPPLGLCYLAGILEKERYPVEIIDANLLQLPNVEIIEMIKGQDPQIVGIYATSLGIEGVEELAKCIKEYFPHIVIVLGGPHVSGYGKDTLQCKSFDFGIIGEGEVSFLNLVKYLETKSGKIEDLKGLVYHRDGEVYQNEPMDLVENLDDLPFPSRHLLPDMRDYRSKFMLSRREPVAHIFTSRGCPFACIFCQTPFGKRVRFHSPQYVINEITQLVEDFGIKEIKINDDTFNLDEKRVFEICNILKRKKIDISWSCNLRVDAIKNKDVLKTMKESGCWLVRIGIESVDQRILDVLKKGITITHVKKVCDWAKEVGLRIQASFILGNPLDNEETIRKTIKFARASIIDYPTFSLMTPFPGTELWNRVQEFGTFDFSRFSDLALSHNPTFVPKDLTKQQLIYFYRKAFSDAYINPKMIFRELRGISTFADFKRLALAAYDMVTAQKEN